MITCPACQGAGCDVCAQTCTVTTEAALNWHKQQLRNKIQEQLAALEENSDGTEGFLMAIEYTRSFLETL